jgi:hypothetical protein
MIAAHRRRTNKLDRERVMITENETDFPAGSPVALISVEIDAKYHEILARDAELVSALGDKSQAQEIKGDARDHLIEGFKDIKNGAIAIGDDVVPGITAKFIVPHPRTEQNLIASAEAWHLDTAPPLEGLFIAAGLLARFRENLISAKNDFQTARDNAAIAAGNHGEAVGALDALVREVMVLSRKRSALVKLKYKDNPGKLAAWAIASHLEQPPQRKVKPPSQ